MFKTDFFLLSLLVLFGANNGLVKANSHSPALGSWFRRVGPQNADGSWLFGWAWGADSVVSVVDHNPPINFASRPASFGPLIEDAVMGYGIPMNAFTVDCEGEGGNKTKSGKRGGFGQFTTETNDETRLVDSNLGCPKLCTREGPTPEPSDSWIAIVQRGDCAFVEKVREAQRFGAKGVVVGGDDPDESGNPDALVSMYSQGDASDVKIPSTFIKYSDYVRLTDLIANSNTSTSGIKTVSLQIVSEYALWEWYSPILTFIVLLLLPSSLTLVTLLIHRVRAARAERRERAPEDVVNNLPWRVWTGTGWEKHEGPPPQSAHAGSKSPSDLENGDPDAEAERYEAQPCFPSTSHRDADDAFSTPPWFDAQTECAICLNEFIKGDRVRVLPCKHIFHMDEVDEWLIHRKKLCPVCKADVTQPAHPYPTAAHADSQSAEGASEDNLDDARSVTSHQSQLSSVRSVQSPTERTSLLAPQQLPAYTHAYDSSSENNTRE